MSLTKIKRPFNPEEQRLFDRAARVVRSKKPKTRWSVVLILILLSVAGALDLWYFNKGKEHVWAICCVCYLPILVWVVIEDRFKQRRTTRRLLALVQRYEHDNSVEVVQVRATQVALLKEFEDESDLFLFELAEGGCLFLWDDQDKTIRNKRFPSSEFDVYTDEAFHHFIGRKVAAYGERSSEITVPRKAKWQ